MIWGVAVRPRHPRTPAGAPHLCTSGQYPSQVILGALEVQLMQCSCSRIVVWGTLAAAFSLPALADLAENTVLQTNQSIDLSTGAVANSGGDLLWNGTTLVPQGSAKATKPGAGGETGYDDT